MIIKLILRLGMIKIACIFPGQGKQFTGMGKDLFGKYKEQVELAESVLGYSIREICLGDSTDILNQTEYTQVGVFFVNTLLYWEFIKKTRTIPDYVAGHSLGEYNALLAAGAFDLETGLELVKERGKLTSEIKDTGMAAIVGIGCEEICEVLYHEDLKDIEISNFNSSKQTVISGLKEDLILAERRFAEKGIYFKQLNVSGAFHSKYMREVSKKFEKILVKKDFKKISIPVISNVTAELYTDENIKSLLVRHLYSPVKWHDTMKKLITINNIQIEQVGYGNVLKNLLNDIKMEY